MLWSGSASASSRLVVQRSISCSAASARSLCSLRPTSRGSGTIRLPSDRASPPCRRIARMERTMCWFVPIRPVTPFMTTPMVRVAASTAMENVCQTSGGGRAVSTARTDNPPAGELSKPAERVRAHLTSERLFGQLAKPDDSDGRLRNAREESKHGRPLPPRRPAPPVLSCFTGGGARGASRAVPLPRLSARGHRCRRAGLHRGGGRRSRLRPLRRDRERDADAERRRRAPPLRLEPLQLGLPRARPLAPDRARIPLVANPHPRRDGRSAPANDRDGDRAG